LCGVFSLMNDKELPPTVDTLSHGSGLGSTPKLSRRCQASAGSQLVHHNARCSNLAFGWCSAIRTSRIATTCVANSISSLLNFKFGSIFFTFFVMSGTLLVHAHTMYLVGHGLARVFYFLLTFYPHSGSDRVSS